MDRLVNLKEELKFYKGKRVLVTGHTGFKGSWLTKILVDLEAIVAGYSLEANTYPNLYSMCDVNEKIKSVIADIRDYDSLYKLFNDFKPELVIHMAAQPLVRESYTDPKYTYDVNMMGTVNVLECIRNCDSVVSFLNVTTDKVYYNAETNKPFIEDESLNGYDPYSNSKSCSELITYSYKNSFFKNTNVSLSTARAGNVIGGGDYSKDRIVPDCVNSYLKKENIGLRNPNSIRPYQHVIEPLFAYLLLMKKQYNNKELEGAYNIGPNEENCVSTSELASIFCELVDNIISWENNAEDNAPHEANFLRLDCTKIKETLNWNPRWSVKIALKNTLDFVRVIENNGDISDEMSRQIKNYMEENL